MKGQSGASDDQKRIAMLVSELIRLSERRYEPCCSDFLSESEQALARRELDFSGHTDYRFFGGYENAQRTVLCVYPPYEEPADEDFPFTAVNLSFRKTAELTHRDFLGSLMGLGIKRESVGDIVIGKGVATFFVKKELASYVSSQLEKVGREGVKLADKGVDFASVTQQFEEFSRTITSLRLDAVVGECTGLSRAKAQQAVKSGMTAVNALIADAPDRRINDGDKISVRGFGKFIIKTDGSLSKKGKIRITVFQYL